MSRLLVVIAAALLGAQITGVARASPVNPPNIVYDLTLTPTLGTIGGSGYFDVAAPLNGSGVNILTDFSVTIDNATFTLANDPTATATFSNGLLSSLNYIGAVSAKGFNLDILGTGGLQYAFIDIGTGAALAEGTIYAVDPPGVPATPLPTTVVMFATGLLALGFLIYRRKAAPAFKIA